MRVLDGVAIVTDGVGEVLNALVLLHDGRIPLRHGVKVMAKEDGSGLLVDAKEALDGKPKSLGSCPLDPNQGCWGAVALCHTCGLRPNLPHMNLKKEAHLL